MDANNTTIVSKSTERKSHFATGKLLLTTIENMTGRASDKYKRRDFVEPLIEFCSDGCYDGKVGIVKVAYAHFNYEEAGMKSVTDEIIRLAEEGVTHFFVDEASSDCVRTHWQHPRGTVGARMARPWPPFCSAGAQGAPLRLPFSHSLPYLSDFVNLAPDWSDWLVPERAIKIIISGTDSFMLWTAQTTSLFHRFYRFSSNWNNFAEYKRITGKSLEQYKREGGVFTTEDMPTYIQSAVIDNLLHTLDHCIDDANRKTIYTARLYGIDREVIYKAVISILKGAAEDSIVAHFIKERVANSLGVYRDFKAVSEPAEIIEALLECLVHIDCLKYRDPQGREIDAVLVNRETKYAVLLEVKSTTKIDRRTVFTDQARHMFDR
jgi:hypothetical protein